MCARREGDLCFCLRDTLQREIRDGITVAIEGQLRGRGRETKRKKSEKRRRKKEKMRKKKTQNLIVSGRPVRKAPC
jgi:hypothetical protein